MEIGVGIAPTLPIDEQVDLAQEAARLGFDYVTTAEGPGQTYFHDAFQMCLVRWLGTKDVVSGGIKTMISVSPVGLRSPVGIAMSAITLSQITGGRFVLGVGTGRAYSPWYREMWGIRDRSTIGLMRDYITAVRALMQSDPIDYDSPHFSLHGAKLNVDAPAPPIYLSALGPNMLKLAGELADGIALNNCSIEYVQSSVRPMVAEAAKEAGRDPSSVKLQQGVQLVIDDDVQAARRVVARGQIGSRSLSPTRTRGEAYHRHDLQQGYEKEIAEVDAMWERGMSEEEILENYPEPLLKGAYYGPMSGAVEAFKRQSQGLDSVVLMPRTAGRDGIEQTKELWRALRPEVLRWP